MIKKRETYTGKTVYGFLAIICQKEYNQQERKKQHQKGAENGENK